jgi:predicted O-linked N-acetylglucosamine transferase (SPINDLY family)
MDEFEKAKNLFLAGIKYLQNSQLHDAENSFLESLKLLPNRESSLNNLAATQIKLKKFDEAEINLKKIIGINNRSIDLWVNLGLLYLEKNQPMQAISFFENCIELDPQNIVAWKLIAQTYDENKWPNKAISCFKKILQISHNDLDALIGIGAILNDLKEFDEAIRYHQLAIEAYPGSSSAYINNGVAFHGIKKFGEALHNYAQAIDLNPFDPEIFLNMGVTLQELKRYDEAISHYDKALSLKPDYAEGWSNKGNALNSLKRHSQSAKCYLKALEFKVDDSYLLGQAHHQMMLECDWTNYEKNINEIFHLVDERRKGAEPFGFQGIADTEELLKKCAEVYSNDKFPALDHLSEFIQYKHHKIRIGYLCGEFREQATSILMTRVWELHDKSNFEIFAFDNGWDDGSDYRQRIEKAFTKIFDISDTSDLEVAKLIQANEIDILVNMNGFFGAERQLVFSYKPAPIQVNYLGFPGTIGIDYIDYIIADKVVIPEGSRKHYIEKLAYLPNSYQANDDKRKISDSKFSRVQLGIPEDAFVFACFNNNYKITPAIFDSWMRILSHTPGSVLWLLADNPKAMDNLIREAAARGIDCLRLIFANRLPISEHLARHGLADLFLDTLPYNAHTTCSDALWAGLPVLTLMGHTFPGRVAASLLSAVGLSELIANTQEEYVSLAIELATNRKKLDGIRERLAKNRLTAPLFNSTLFAKNLETVYIKMYERHLEGLLPECINI